MHGDRQRRRGQHLGSSGTGVVRGAGWVGAGDGAVVVVAASAQLCRAVAKGGTNAAQAVGIFVAGIVGESALHPQVVAVVYLGVALPTTRRGPFPVPGLPVCVLHQVLNFPGHGEGLAADAGALAADGVEGEAAALVLRLGAGAAVEHHGEVAAHRALYGRL